MIRGQGDQTGVIFNVQRYSIHDGPGIRTTVFLKGCPLRCIWCCNPESQRLMPEIGCYPDRCIQCGACAARCPSGAIEVSPGGSVVDWDSCDRCGLCAGSCVAGGVERVGRHVTVEEVVDEVEKDLSYYSVSGGGVTISGGEPTVQPEFAKALLAALSERGIHTAMETCGLASWNTLASLLPYLDVVLFDIKHVDTTRHRQLTGFGNESILANARLVAESGVRMVARAPIVPGCNDDQASITGLISFVASLRGVEELHFLPYHRLGVGKTAAIGGRPSFDSHAIPSADSLGWALSLAQETGLQTQFGG